MKIHIITSIAFPNGMAPGNRIKCYAGAIAEAGLDCEVIIYRRTERHGVAPQNTLAEGQVFGVPYRYIGGTPLRGSNKLIRCWHDVCDKQALKRHLRRHLHAGDVLFLYAGLDAHYNVALCRLAHRRGCKVVRELCELPFGTTTETSRTARLRRYTEQKVFPLCDGIVPISDALMQYARQYARPSCRFQKIPILVDYDRYALPDRSAESDVPYIFHAGTLYDQKDGILGMIEAFGMARQKLSFPIQLICTGRKENSRHHKEIEALILKYHLQDALIFTGYLSDDGLKDHLQRASLVVINKHPNQQNTYCFSTKLGEYMAAGKAIIITRMGEAMNWLTDGTDACIVEPDDVTALADAMVHLFEDSALRHKLGNGAKETCQSCFDFRTQASVLKTYFESL